VQLVVLDARKQWANPSLETLRCANPTLGRTFCQWSPNEAPCEHLPFIRYGRLSLKGDLEGVSGWAHVSLITFMDASHSL